MSRRSIGRSKSSTAGSKGFTLIEMMVTISIILILLGVALPIYSHSITRAREDNLRKNLETLNYMIYQYTQDKQKAPQALQDLVSAKYLDKVPDDITGSPDTWEVEQGEDVIMSLDQTDSGGVIGVHSGSNQVGTNGTAYSSW